MGGGVYGGGFGLTSSADTHNLYVALGDWTARFDGEFDRRVYQLSLWVLHGVPAFATGVTNATTHDDSIDSSSYQDDFCLK